MEDGRSSATSQPPHEPPTIHECTGDEWNARKTLRRLETSRHQCASAARVGLSLRPGDLDHRPLPTPHTATTSRWSDAVDSSTLASTASYPRSQIQSIRSTGTIAGEVGAGGTPASSNASRNPAS